MFIATDGAHTSTHAKSGKDRITNTSSSFVICKANTNNNTTSEESRTNSNWIDTSSIPLLCRTANLPYSFGPHKTDIAHGELQAIAMQELALAPEIPRVIITDSEAIRNITMDLKNSERENINRKLIRTSMGGASKFLSSSILSSWNSIQPTSVINGSIEDLKTLQESTINFLKIAESWTVPPIDEENAKEHQYGVWKREYYDDCEIRPILKVNSHQLNGQGTNIKTPPRYAKLVPNISILNMNHHADIGAEIGTKYLNTNEENFKLTMPPSILRFQFTWEGSVVDRHINQFIREQIHKERVIRLKTKDTQGLLWRFIEETSCDWSDIMKHKGWLRALSGLSRTHTRSLYKSEVYRTGCNNDRINVDFKNNICPEIDEQNLKVKEIINKCSGCTWCPRHEKMHNSKGNRSHAMLNCTHPYLSSFRKKMSNIIEQQLKVLLLNLQKYTDNQYVTDALLEVEKECHFLQESNLGRNGKVYHKEFSYISSKELLKKHDIQSCIEGLKVKGKFCSEIMGIKRQQVSTNKLDKHLGILDAYWLGMVPLRVDQAMTSSFSPFELLRFTGNMATCKAFSNELKKSWNTIKDLLKAKAIGLHRIIGGLSKQKEESYKEKYHLSKGTYREINEERKKKNSEEQLIPKNTQTTNADSNSNASEEQTISSTIINSKSKEPQDKVTCRGITCNRENQKWSVGQNYSQQKILHTTKHCQRCSKFNTAMKQSASILDNIGIQPATSKSEELGKTISYAINNGINYTLMTTMLEECQTPTELPSAQAITIKKPKSRILDRHKLICRVITQAMKMTTYSDANSKKSSTFSIAAKKIRKGKEKGESNLRQSKQSSPQAQHLTYPVNEQEIISIDSSQETNATSELQQERVSLTNRKIFREISEDGKFISDDAITMAVEVLRHTFHNPNIFIAHGLANVTIEEWNQTLGWERFGRIFGTRNATFNKPDGTYLIPMFSGGNDAGHWHLVVVQKRGRYHQGWILDSLGNGRTDSATLSKIKAAFITNRGRLDWNAPRSRRQVEYECGPRTIKAMLDICKGLENRVSIDECIQMALLTEREADYNAGSIRREVLRLTRNHNTDMRTARITFRQQGYEVVAGGRGVKRKREPKK